MGRARRAVGDLRSAENYDAVILSELVYDEELHAELVATLGRALRPGAVAHSVFCDRPWSFNFFVQLAEAGAVPPFVVSEVEPSELLELDTEAESLHLHVIAHPVRRGGARRGSWELARAWRVRCTVAPG